METKYAYLHGVEGLLCLVKARLLQSLLAWGRECVVRGRGRNLHLLDAWKVLKHSLI